MTARFPVISPHGTIKNSHCRIVDRVVDGGYFENYGATTVSELATALKRFDLNPFIILVDNEPTASNKDCSTLAPMAPLDQRKVPTAISFATINSPLGAILGTRNARGSLAGLELCNAVTDKVDDFAFITVEPNPNNPAAEISMSWWLSKFVQKYLDEQLDPGTSLGNDRAFAKIEAARMLKP